MKENPELSRWEKVVLAILVLEILTGIIMAYFGVPAFAQPVHLTLGDNYDWITIYDVVVDECESVVVE